MGRKKLMMKKKVKTKKKNFPDDSIVKALQGEQIIEIDENGVVAKAIRSGKERQSDFKPTNPKDRMATSRLDISLFPQTAIIYGAMGMTEGDSKYGGYNYRAAGVLASIYYAAAQRHLMKWFNGEEVDPKTKVPHLASALACTAILIDAVVCNMLKDDRPPKAPVGELLDSAEVLVKHLHTLFPNGVARYTEVDQKNKKGK